MSNLTSLSCVERNYKANGVLPFEKTLVSALKLLGTRYYFCKTLASGFCKTACRIPKSVSAFWCLS